MFMLCEPLPCSHAFQKPLFFPFQVHTGAGFPRPGWQQSAELSVSTWSFAALELRLPLPRRTLPFPVPSGGRG